MPLFFKLMHKIVWKNNAKQLSFSFSPNAMIGGEMFTIQSDKKCFFLVLDIFESKTKEKTKDDMNTETDRRNRKPNRRHKQKNVLCRAMPCKTIGVLPYKFMSSFMSWFMSSQILFMSSSMSCLMLVVLFVVFYVVTYVVIFFDISKRWFSFFSVDPMFLPLGEKRAW